MTSTIGRPTTMRHSRNRTNGFTLLELLFVIFLLGLMARFAIPKFNQITTINLRSATRQLSGLIKFTFNRAVMTRQPYRLVIDINEGTYWVEQYRTVKPSEQNKDENQDESEPEKTGKEFAKVTGYLNQPGKLPDGVHLAKYIDAKNETSVTTGKVHLYFYPVGETSGGTLILETSEDTAMTLIINPITGLVHSYRGVIEDTRDIS